MVRSTPASVILADVDVTAMAPDAFPSFSSPRPQTSVQKSLIAGRFDQGSCGVGFVASIAATASHTILTQALTALGRLAHRGAVAADGKSSDGVGVTTAVPP